MGAYALFCRRFAVYCGDDPFVSDVQAHGYFEYRGGFVHGLAELALGYQAFVESVHRFDAYQALVDCHDAVADRRGIGRHRFSDTCRSFLSVYIGIVLADVLLISKPCL